MGKKNINDCEHHLWELIEDSEYWMFQCIGCGLCHEMFDLPLWLKDIILKQDWDKHREITKWAKENVDDI